MEAPQNFSTRLKEAFDGRLRIRWSYAEREFQIEQKVGRQVMPTFFIADDQDALIRARDGYHLVMSVTPGDRKPCPDCGYQLTVPVMDTWDIRCPYCAIKGRQTRTVAGYWPLNDRLIDHLRKIDPLRVGANEQLAEDADRHNQALLRAQENDALEPGNAYAEEHYNRMVGIAQVGRTGKENCWDHK